MMEKLKQNQLNSLEMSKIVGARTKQVDQGTDNNGTCIQIIRIDKNDGTPIKVVVKGCNALESLDSDMGID